MARLELRGVSKSFGTTAVIRPLDLVVEDGEFCVLVGPSGCGKSTLLRLMAGLEACSSGDVLIEHQRVTDQPPAQRGIAMVFQSYALYPHMSVAENMGFGLKMSGASAQDIAPRVRKAAQILQIEGLLTRRPKELSGGQRQRVAIGRAIVRNPKLFLLDEPLSNLDAALRVDMRIELAQLRKQLGATFVYVTHDQVEAMTLADKIVVLREGRIEQVGAPMHLYRQPANRFVAGFIGSPKMNFFPARLAQDGPQAQVLAEGGARWSLAPGPLPPAQSLTLGVRPENMRLVDPASALWQGPVTLIERRGSASLVHLRVGEQQVQVQVDGQLEVQEGQTVGLWARAADLHVFDAADQRLELLLQ